MKRVRMVVAYDGTAYRGWQLQPNGITIEEVLNRELTALLKESISVIGASRTDSGVRKRSRRTGIPERLTVSKPTNIRY